ncbi:MAG: hypothetical protein AAFY16_02110 [Cyanobacteria bacterium J06642_3]
MRNQFRNNTWIPTPTAWNFVGFGLMWFLIGQAWSISRAKAYELELAQFKLAVGTVLSEVKEVINTHEQSVNTDAIAPQERRKIQQLTQHSNAVIEQVESQVEQSTDKLIYLEEDL